MRFFSRRVRVYSDSEIIERARNDIDRRRRWSWWFNGLCSVATIAGVATIGWAISRIINMVINRQAVSLEVFIAALVGFMIGKMFFYVQHAAAMVLVRDWFQIDVRKDEMLVEYHDALLELSHEQRSDPHEDPLAIHPQAG